MRSIKVPYNGRIYTIKDFQSDYMNQFKKTLDQVSYFDRVIIQERKTDDDLTLCLYAVYCQQTNDLEFYVGYNFSSVLSVFKSFHSAKYNFDYFENIKIV